MKPIELENGLHLYALSMGKVFRVLAVCNTDQEADEVMRKNSQVSLIALDKQGRSYLANRYGRKLKAETLIQLD